MVSSRLRYRRISKVIMKILCFHPALAPYRIDLFNLLGKQVRLKVVFLQNNLQTQKFDQDKLLADLNIQYEFLTQGISIGGRYIRTGLLQIIRKEQPDVVIGFEASPVTLTLLAMKKLGLIKACIWTSMDDSPDQVRGRIGLRRFMRDFVLRNVAHVIVPSEAALLAYCEVLPSVPSERYSVVPIIHDTEIMRENADKVYALGSAWRAANCPNEWERIIVFVGRFAEVKNLPWLLERMQELPKSVGLVLVGDGDLREELKNKVDRMGLGTRVLFAGRKEGDELYSIMANSDVLALTSTAEPFGAVVAEALQWGTPCLVSSNCGAAVLIKDGENGAVFTSGDATDFRTAFSRIPKRSNKSLLKSDLRQAVANLVKEIR